MFKALLANYKTNLKVDFRLIKLEEDWKIYQVT